HCDDGVADAADGIGEAVIVHAGVAGVVARMDMDDGAGLIRCRPERVEVGGVEHAADPAWQGRDHRAASNVAQALHDRPRRLAAAKGDRQARTILDQAQRAEAPTLLANGGKKVGRHEMAMNIDDHFGSSMASDLSRAAAIMSASCAILIGRLFTTIPSGRTASLTALAIAAGAPR